jgi:hypothetical protein
MSVQAFIGCINKGLAPFFNSYTNASLLGLARPTLRVRKIGDQEAQQIIPCVVDRYGEAVEVSIDDTKPIILYHKMLGMQSQMKTGTGVGDNQGDYINTYNMQMVVYYGMDKVLLLQDEFYMQLLYYVPKIIKDTDPFKMAQITLTGVNTDIFGVFNQEYKNVVYRMKLNDILLTVNYSVSAILKPSCINPIC